MRVTWTEQAKDKLADFYITLTLDEQREVARNVMQMNGLWRSARTSWANHATGGSGSGSRVG
jgi:hypothetical protein